MNIQKYIFSFLFFLSCIISLPLSAQQLIRLSGVVTDSLSSEPIPYVSVYLKGTTTGVMTDEEGHFELHAKSEDILSASSLGYHEYYKPVREIASPGKIRIRLTPSQYELKEVLIKPKKEKYTKKGNPAVEFVKNIIDHRNENDPQNKDFFYYERYEKLTYAFNEFDEERLQKGLYKKFGFLKNHIDTSEISGKPILIVSNKEV
ncbi:MAG: carboxypeptidase-like regulatory domain-containing protein, partial [Bacteroidales bacterium]